MYYINEKNSGVSLKFGNKRRINSSLDMLMNRSDKQWKLNIIE
jgi:hypothetical protein